MLGANGIVGGGPLLVVGAVDREDAALRNVAVAFTGDGGSNQGTTFEAMNLAVVLQLPAIFVFENNGYGEYTGAAYAVGSHDIAGRAAGFGMPATKGQRRRLLRGARSGARGGRARFRNGGGPSAIEVDTCRFYGHHSGDGTALSHQGRRCCTLREERDCLAALPPPGWARPACWKCKSWTRFESEVATC